MQQMLDNRENSFWLENVGNLFSSGSMIPLSKDSLEEQMNALTRFVLLIFIFLFFFRSSEYAICVSFLCATLIGITYYTWKFFIRKQVKETYGNIPSVQEPANSAPRYTAVNDLVLTPNYSPNSSGNLPSTGKIIINENSTNPQLIDGRVSSFWEYENVPVQNTVSNNQQLVGAQNPKTLVQPIIPTPAYDNQVWQPNDFFVPSCINQQQRQELHSNGYVSNVDTIVVDHKKKPILESYSPNNSQESIPNYSSHLLRNPSLTNNNYMTTTDDLVNFGCGYQPLNLETNLPTNYIASTHQANPSMSKFNENLYTIPIQPGLYTKSQVNQTDASMSNLGISHNQQFLPTSFENKTNYQTFVELDPYQNKPIRENYASPEEPFRRDIYDPRLTGYGTSYRSYLDPMTGQPRFYYRDIDQQTQNAYLTKNNIDFAQFGTTTGVFPFDKPLEGQALHSYADNTYTDSQIGYRSELQQRLLHKNSAREWQQRLAPIRTNQQTKGFMGTNSSKSYAGPRGG